MNTGNRFVEGHVNVANKDNAAIDVLMVAQMHASAAGRFLGTCKIASAVPLSVLAPDGHDPGIRYVLFVAYPEEQRKQSTPELRDDVMQVMGEACQVVIGTAAARTTMVLVDTDARVQADNQNRLAAGLPPVELFG